MTGVQTCALPIYVAAGIIVKHKEDITRLSDKLLKEETISNEEFVDLIGPAKDKENI